VDMSSLNQWILFQFIRDAWNAYENASHKAVLDNADEFVQFVIFAILYLDDDEHRIKLVKYYTRLYLKEVNSQLEYLNSL